MIEAKFDGTWRDWRNKARPLLTQRIPPEEILWTTEDSLLNIQHSSVRLPKTSERAIRIPAAVIDSAKTVSCHRNPEPWHVLYRVFYRLSQAEPHLLELESDEDVIAFRCMEKSVHRDIHKMHAFVRFRKTAEDEYVAWYKPDHRILREAAPFFVRRFGDMKWAILTPEESAYWDKEELTFGPGAPREAAPGEDQQEELWRTYYKSIFNPARRNEAAMVKELPRRHWATLPEAQLIPALLANADTRVHHMEPVASAATFIPRNALLPQLRQAVQQCKGCPLYGPATQGVFGEGPADARLVLVGEQPGDQEDRTGKPFTGPAGEVLNQALREAGIDRGQVYVTNAVKHFKFEQRGKRRIHSTPRGTEIAACRPWLEQELRQIQPDLIVCMGATAAQSVFGRAVRVNAERGQFLPHHYAREAMVTVHPSAILRIPDTAQAEAERARFTDELRRASARAEILRQAS